MTVAVLDAVWPVVSVWDALRVSDGDTDPVLLCEGVRACELVSVEDWERVRDWLRLRVLELEGVRDADAVAVNVLVRDWVLVRVLDCVLVAVTEATAKNLISHTPRTLSVVPSATR